MTERINVEGLRYARAVAETGSFTAAARVYGVTQPALSNGIAKLEAKLGGQLFARTTRGVTPTEFGSAVLPLIERALVALDDVTAEAVRWHSAGDESIRLGVSPLINPSLVARVYSAACSQTVLPRPRQLVLREANMVELQLQLTNGGLDLVLIPSVMPLPRYCHRVIDSEPVVLVDARTVDAEVAEVDAMTDRPLILLPDTCGLTTFTQALMRSHGMPLRPYPGEAASYRMLEDWAALGLGSAVLPLSKLSGPDAPHRPLVDDGLEVEIFYEAIWDPHSPIADDLARLADHVAADQRS